MSDPHRVTTTADGFGGGCLLFFGLPFTLAGCFVLWLGVSLWTFRAESSDWVEAPARIEQLEFVDRGSGKSRVVKLTCTYAYEHGGKTYRGTRLGLESEGLAPDVSQSRARYAILESARRAGATVPARVDPRAPERSVLFRDPGTMAYVAAPFGLVFALIGLSLQGSGLWLVLDGRRRRAGRLRWPDRPWRWEGLWDGFVLTSGTWGHVMVAWIGALICAGFISVFVIAFALDRNVPLFAKALVGFFALIAVAVVAVTVHATLHRLKYGASRLVLSRVPIALGSTFDASIIVDRSIEASTVALTLSCTRTERSGKSSHEVTLTTLEARAPVNRGGRGQVRIPVHFDIPQDVEPRSCDGPPVRWTLTAAAETPGVDFGARFPDLPVYRVADASQIEHNPEYQRGGA